MKKQPSPAEKLSLRRKRGRKRSGGASPRSFLETTSYCQILGAQLEEAAPRTSGRRLGKQIGGGLAL